MKYLLLCLFSQSALALTNPYINGSAGMELTQDRGDKLVWGIEVGAQSNYVLAASYKHAATSDFYLAKLGLPLAQGFVISALLGVGQYLHQDSALSAGAELSLNIPVDQKLAVALSAPLVYTRLVDNFSERDVSFFAPNIGLKYSF